MRFIIAAALVFSSCVFAQEAPLKSPATGDPNENASAPKTYEGCVVRSGGSFVLADASHRNYYLVTPTGNSFQSYVGQQVKLKSYVGQEVKVTATNVNPNDPSSDERGIGDMNPVHQQPTLAVEHIAMMSNHCSAPK